VSQGIKVRGMVRREEAMTEVEQMGATPVLADLTDAVSVQRAVEGTAGVYHIAAAFRQAGVPDSYFEEINIGGTRHVFDACIASNVQRVVHCSTVGVISNTTTIPADESTPYSPGDIYQETKMEGEKLALEYFRSGKVSGVVIRPAMIYGPGDTRTLKLFKMVAGRKFFYVGPGDAHVHFIDARDLARAFQLGMERTDLNGEIYIVAGERAFRLHEVVAEIAGYFNVATPRLHLPVKPMQWLGSACEAICEPFGINPPIFRRRVDFFTKERCFDGSRANRELGFEPRQTSVEEIHEICRWYVDHGHISSH
jgi:nucleoside-diphosphate-sugar epimerase